MSLICLDSDDEDEDDSVLLSFEPLRKRRKPAQASLSGRPGAAPNSESSCASIESNNSNKRISSQQMQLREVPVLQSGKPLHVDDASDASEFVLGTVDSVDDGNANDDSSCDTKELAWKIKYPNMPYLKHLADSPPAAKKGAMKTSTGAGAAPSPADDFCLPEQDSSSSSCSDESDYVQEKDKNKLVRCPTDPTPIPQSVSLGPRDGHSPPPAHPITTRTKTINPYLGRVQIATNVSRNLSSHETCNENHLETASFPDQSAAPPILFQKSEEAAFFPDEDHAFDHRQDNGTHRYEEDAVGPYGVDDCNDTHPSADVRMGLHPQRQVLVMRNETDPLLNGEDDIENFSDDDQHVFRLGRSSVQSNGNMMSPRMQGSSTPSWRPFPSRNDARQFRYVQSPQNRWQAFPAVQGEPSNDGYHNGSFEDDQTFQSHEQYIQPEVPDVYANNGVADFNQPSIHSRRIIRNAAASNTAHLTGIVMPQGNDVRDYNYQSAPHRNDLTGGSGVEASHGGGYYSFLTNRPPSQAARPSHAAMFSGDSGDATFTSSYGYHDSENLDNANVPDTGRRYKAARSASGGRGSSAQRGRRAAGRGGFRKKRGWGKGGKSGGRGRGNNRVTASGNGRFGGRGGSQYGTGRGCAGTGGRDDPNLGHIGGADINF